MKNLRSVFAALLLSMSCLLTAAHGQITPSGDTFSNNADPTTNYGAGALILVNGTSESTETAYIQFNLASIPAGAVIGQATLKLYVNAVTTAGSFNVYYVDGAWSESTLTYDFAPALANAIASNVSITTADKNQYVLIDITSALQAWLSGSLPNDGLALVANSTFYASFDSKENTTTSHPPELDIVFAGDGTITGLTTATGSGLAGGGTNGTLNLSLTNSCATNQVLQWNGSSWICSAAGTGTITGVTTAAGGGLAGGGTGGTLNLSLTNTCAANQVLQFTGTTWACASVGTGTITGVTAGADLTGGGTSGSVTLNLNVESVPLLAAANTFTGNQAVTGNLTATGVVSGSRFEIGGTLFGFGTSTAGNAFLGFAGNVAVTGTSDTGTGFGALHGNTSGAGNTANGYEALEVNTTGDGNTATGVQTLFANTTGGNNNAIGGYALFSNTTGASNNAVGNSALYNNNDGNNNNAVGFDALYSNTSGINNDANGADALYNNTTGNSNEGSGEGALYNNISGNHNTGVGFNALFTNTTGSNNTGIGYGAGTDSTTTALTNATAVGAWADVAESNAVVLGSIQGVNGCLSTNIIPCSTANVGIGTTTPQATLDIEGTTPTVNFGNATNPATLAVNGNAGFSGTVTIANLNVTGTLSKPSGSFKIDHPLDPANKYLYHSFVESPDMMNIYNGNISTDDSGLATVTLPDWFEALNQDFRYQLTVIGQFAQAIVASEISHNQFTIRTDRPNVKVSWQVTGIRHDAYANAHRIPTEVEKPADEQGHYLHPELFGAPAELAVGYHDRTNATQAANSGQTPQALKK
jgi:hypothetical protein